MKYRKKPIVVEAFQLGVDRAPDCFKDWFKQRYSAISEVTISSKGDIDIIIRTLEGEMHARKGDYIVQGVNGEIYPVKADIFEKTYERVYDDGK